MRVLSSLLILGLTLVPGAGAETPTPDAGKSGHVPVYAYFYQWFDSGSWNRAKIDFPLAGKYSSDDPHVLRDQVQQAQSAGIDGFLTSWKSTPTLNRRLGLLISLAQERHLDLGVVYEALDFNRNPLPISTVQADMVQLVTQWGASLRSAYYGRPVIVWTGTDQYSVADVRAVRAALGNRAYLLAASKTVAGYERVANTVDGEAYYWSSVNPTASSTQAKLNDLGAAVHSHHGIWIAPAASGFDGRSLGSTRVVDRAGGQTLVRSLANAYRSRPDGVGVISWNEWSENTYIEPGQLYGTEELDLLRTYLHQVKGASVIPTKPSHPVAAKHGHWSGLRAAAALAVLTAIALVVLSLRIGRPARDRERTSPGPDDDAGPGDNVSDGDNVSAGQPRWNEQRPLSRR
jgi:hypothetical protein